MKYNSAILVILFSLSCSPHIEAADVDAQNKCKTIHHTDVDLKDTMYLNQQCLLNCNIHGHIWSHEMNEGMSCAMSTTTGICKGGECVRTTSVSPTPTPVPNPSGHLGHIDIEMESASFSQPANSYAMVCVQNFTDSLNLPIVDRSKCTTCTTSIVSSSTFPVWHSICSGSGTILFNDQARVTFEVFDNFATGSQVFLGGASLTIPQLLSHADNHKRLHLALTGGHIAGQINARVTWTPKV